MSNTTNQPTWQFIANLGDASPVDHGGYFVFTDATGQYHPEAELLEVNEDGKRLTWKVYRVQLETCHLTSDGRVGDNNFHPDHRAWFDSKDYENRPQDSGLDDVASFIGVSVEELRAMFVSSDICEVARAYQAVGDYYGWDNFDDDPLVFEDKTARKDVIARFKDIRGIDID